MYTFLTYIVSLFVIVITVFITLFFKYELEQMFGEKKDVIPFHICNMLITLFVSFGTYAVMTIYITGNELNWITDFVILLFIIIPIYIIGHLAFEKYKFIYRKYKTAEDGKVIVLNERYLQKKKRFPKLRDYNAVSKDKNISREYENKRFSRS